VLVLLVQRWQERTFKDGFNAGSAAATAAYETSRALATEQALTRLASRVEQSNKAVQEYVEDIAAREPEIITLTKEIERYVQSSDGGAVCVDADGMRLLERARSAASGRGADPARSGKP